MAEDGRKSTRWSMAGLESIEPLPDSRRASPILRRSLLSGRRVRLDLPGEEEYGIDSPGISAYRSYEYEASSRDGSRNNTANGAESSYAGFSDYGTTRQGSGYSGTGRVSEYSRISPHNPVSPFETAKGIRTPGVSTWAKSVVSSWGRDGPASRNGSRASSRGILRTASGVDTQPPPYEARHGGYDHFQDTPGGHDHYHDSPAPQRRAKHASSLRTERSQSLKSKRGGGFDAVEVRDAVLRRFGGEVGIAGLGGLPGGPMFGEHSRTDAGETGRIREPAMDYLARLTSPSFGGFSAAPARSAFEKTAPPPANASHAFRQRGGEEWDGKDLGLAGARRGGQATGYVPAGYEAAARVGTAPWMKRPLKREVESLGIKQVGGDRDRSSIVSMVFSTDGGTLLCGEAQGRVTLFRRNTALDHPQSSRGGAHTASSWESFGASERMAEDVPYWEEEGKFQGHPQHLWGMAISIDSRLIFTVGQDDGFRVFADAIYDGKTEGAAAAALDLMSIRKELGKRGVQSTGNLFQVLGRLREALRDDPAELRRLGIDDVEVDHVERRWVEIHNLQLMFGHTVMPFNGGTVKPEAFCVVAHPSLPLLATAWVDGCVRVLVGEKHGGKTSDADGMVHDAWDFEWTQELQAHSSQCYAVAFGNGPIQHLASVSKDFSLAVFRPEPDVMIDGYTPVVRMGGHMAPCLGLAFHPGGGMIVTGSADTFAVAWHIVEDPGAGLIAHGGEGNPIWRCWGSIPGHTTHVRAVAFRPDGLLLATSSYDGQIRLWRTPREPSTAAEPQRKFKCIETLTAGCDVPSLSFGRGKNNGILVAATRKGEVFTWDTAPFLPMMATLEPDHYHANLAASSATMSPMSFARQQHANSQHANSQHLMGMSSKAAFPASSYFTNTSAGGFSPYPGAASSAHSPYHVDEQSYASKLFSQDRKAPTQGSRRKPSASSRGGRGTGQDTLFIRNQDIADEVRTSRPTTGETDWSHFSFGHDSEVPEKFQDADPWKVQRHEKANEMFSKKTQVEELKKQQQQKQSAMRGGRKGFNKSLVQEPEEVLDKALKIVIRMAEVVLSPSQAFSSLELDQAGYITLLEYCDYRDEAAIKSVLRKLLSSLESLLVRGGLLHHFPNLPQGRRNLQNRILSKEHIEDLLTRVDVFKTGQQERLRLLQRRPTSKGSALKEADPTKKGPMHLEGETHVSSHKYWSGAHGRPEKNDRCQHPLLAAATPNTIAASFAPGIHCRLAECSFWLCLATSKKDNAASEEQKDRLRETIRSFTSPEEREKLKQKLREMQGGVSVRLKVFIWDVKENRPLGECRFTSDEFVINEPLNPVDEQLGIFEGVTYPPNVTVLDGGGGTQHRQFVQVTVDMRPANLYIKSYEHLMFCWTSVDCTQKRRGALWVAAVGARNKHNHSVPKELHHGMWVSTDPPARHKGKWTQAQELPACKVRFVPDAHPPN